MSSIPTLPLELQNSIIDCAAEPDGSEGITETIQACSLVSKGWYAGAQCWIFQRLEFTAHFTDTPNEEADRQNEVIQNFLQFIKTKPEVKHHIESLRLNVKSSALSALRKGKCSDIPKHQIKALAVELKDVIREVGLLFYSPKLISESKGVKKSLFDLCSGPKLETLYLHNSRVPSTFEALTDVKSHMCYECNRLLDNGKTMFYLRRARHDHREEYLIAML